MTFRPLAGLRVLDLTSVVVGPVCTGRLAQYGAEVIKLESPEGDLMRGLGGISPTGEHSGTYLHLNRGKRNICCDLKNAASLRLIDKLVERSDVIVANMRPQALARLGLDADSIRSRWPGKIYCLISGYGTDGPYAGDPTYDSVVQAVSGITGLTLARDGRPAYVPMLICDHVVGEITAGAILAAVLQQRTSGEGASIEVPMFETMAAFVLQEHLAQQSFVPPVGPPGDRRLLSPHNKPVETADGWISFTINTDKQVKAFLRAVGRDDLLDDPRFASVATRAMNVDSWFAIRGAPLTSKSTTEWLDIFQRADIASKPCHTLETIVDDPHLNAVSFFVPDDHPTEGATIAMRSAFRVDGAPLDLQSFAQPKGWETKAILADLGYGEREIDELIQGKAVVAV
ncbi:CoA transferase [Sphingomonas sp. BIUV-7]|uniref:CoA transferase n=1 Tax=Sphingomonas natans TaxID=3063330 RepID=A0ABT8YAB7_9SPHN|nr:CoA transferase [Sphingomonas sp. BIUV-7]MDO6415271.1 CoA transferase [Sphingomonas sp. BIUV-7]